MPISFLKLTMKDGMDVREKREGYWERARKEKDKGREKLWRDR